MSAIHDVVLIAGDGIGPEVMRATRRVLEATGAPLRFTERFAGESALAAGHGGALAHRDARRDP